MNRGRGGAALLLALTLTGCAPPAPPAPVVVSEVPVATPVVGVVVDGDTIDVAVDAGTVRVRLIGIDTPEIGRGGEASECYAEDARTFLNDLLYKQEVRLVSDPTQADTDKYGRLLRHVYLRDESAAQSAILAGAGREYTYATAYAGQREHQAAEHEAASSRTGLWSAC